MKPVEKAMSNMPFPTLKTVVKQICITFGLKALVVSFLSTRFLQAVVVLTLLCQFMVCLTGAGVGGSC